MNNAELFKKIFGIYAEEFWACPEEKMLDWLTSDAPNMDVGDIISRQAAIEEVLELDAKHRVSWKDAVIDTLDALPPAQPRKKGKWVNRWSGDGSVWLEEICSECGLTFEDEPHGYNYCPNCGAEMEKEA